MSLIKWEPFGELEHFFEDRSFFNFPKLGWDMAIDLFEEKGNIMAKMTPPGVDPKDLAISVENDTLRVSGRREEEKETEEKDYYSKEIRRGSFSRSVRLPKAVDSSKVDAEYKGGVLEIKMPLAGAKEKSKITVRTSA